MTDRDLMQQTLEALESAQKYVEIALNTAVSNDAADAWIQEKEAELQAHEAAITALRERLSHCGRCGKRLGDAGHIHTCTPKQTAQQPLRPQAGKSRMRDQLIAFKYGWKCAEAAHGITGEKK